MAISRLLRSHTVSTRVFRAAAGCALFVALLVPARAGAQEVAAAPAMPPDPTDTRLLLGPTGRSLRSGAGYAGVYGFVFPIVQVGITDRISVGGGLPLLFPPEHYAEVIADEWEPTSPITGKLDAFEWKVPMATPAGRPAPEPPPAPTGTQLLPLAEGQD